MVRKRSIGLAFLSGILLAATTPARSQSEDPTKDPPKNGQSETEAGGSEQSQNPAQNGPAEQPAPSENGQQAPPDPIALAILKLEDINAPVSERRAAAREIIAAAASGSGTVLLEPLAAAPMPITAESALGLFATVVAERAVAPDVLFPPLTAAVTRARDSAESLSVLLPAIGSFRSRDAAGLLLDHTDANHSGAVRAAAFRALERLASLTLEPSREAWLAWFENVSELDEPGWREYLFENLARERDRLARAGARTNTRLTEIARQLNLLTPADQRSALLAGYLLDPNPTLRQLGFELVERELRQSNRLNGEVAQAAITLLDHSEAGVRRGAARIIDQLAPPDAAPMIAAALTRETDPSAAVSLLSASARWPSAGSLPAVLKWLETGGEPFAPAVHATAELARRGLLPQDHAPRVAAILRTHPVESLPDPGLGLLAETGDDADRARIAALLTADGEAKRRASARALLPRADFVDRIILAAKSHPDLLPIAADCVIAHRPTALGYSAIAELLPAPRQPAGTALLERIAGALPVGDRLEAARSEPDPDFARRILAPLADAAFAPPPDQLPAYADAMATLAEMRIAAFQSDGALSALARIPEQAALPPDRLIRLRTRALLLGGRAQDALPLGAPANVWLNALEQLLSERAAELAIDLAAAKAVQTAIEQNFLDSLAEPAKTRYDALAQRLAARLEPAQKPPAEQPPEGGSGGGGGPPNEQPDERANEKPEEVTSPQDPPEDPDESGGG